MSVPRIALLVIDDRGWTREAIESFRYNASGLASGPVFTVDDRTHVLGFCGAIREGWELLRGSLVEFDYVFHLESDFRFLAPFDLGLMAAILDAHPWLSQVALKRGPHGSEPEGGFMAAWPDQWDNRSFRYSGVEHPYCVQTAFFTTNPSLYKRSLVEVFDWPEAPACEQGFAHMLFTEGYDGGAYLGHTTDTPLVEHIGTRTGQGY